MNVCIYIYICNVHCAVILGSGPQVNEIVKTAITKTLGTNQWSRDRRNENWNAVPHMGIRIGVSGRGITLK